MGVNLSTDEIWRGDFMFHAVVVQSLVNRASLILMSLYKVKWVSQ